MRRTLLLLTVGALGLLAGRAEARQHHVLRRLFSSAPQEQPIDFLNRYGVYFSELPRDRVNRDQPARINSTYDESRAVQGPPNTFGHLPSTGN